MSRGDDLRQLAAQLTVLPSSRTPLRSASPGSWAALAPPLARTQPSQPLQRPRLRPPRPFGSCPATRLQRPCRAQQPPRRPPPGPAPGLALLCRCRSVLRGAAPALSLSRADPSPSLSRDWSRAWPSRAAHQSLPLSCASPVSLARLLQLRALRGPLVKLLRLLHQRKPLRLPAFQRLRPTPMMTGTLSSMHMASPRLPVALRPPSPSRPTPLELVGAPATSAAAVCARPPSALCGGRSDVLSPVLCALSAGVASSCGFVCFSVGAGLLFRWRREADFGRLLRFLPPVPCGARLSLRVGSVLWGMSTAPLVFDVLLGDATLAYTRGAPCLARDCPGGFCPLSRGSCPLAPLLCESSRASDLTLRASLARAFVARFPRSHGVGLHV